MRVSTGGRVCIRVTFYSTLCVVAVLNMAILFSADLLQSSIGIKHYRGKQEQSLKKSPLHRSLQHPSSLTGQQIINQQRNNKELHLKIQQQKAEIENKVAYKSAQNVSLSFVEETLSRLRSELLLGSSDIHQLGVDQTSRNRPKHRKIISLAASLKKEKTVPVIDKHAAVTEKLPNIVIHELAEPIDNSLNAKVKLASKTNSGRIIKGGNTAHHTHERKSPQSNVAVTNDKKKLTLEISNKFQISNAFQNHTGIEPKLYSERAGYNHVFNTQAKKLTIKPIFGTDYRNTVHISPGDTNKKQKHSIQQLEQDKSRKSKDRSPPTRSRDEEKNLQVKHESNNSSRSYNDSKISKTPSIISKSSSNSSSAQEKRSSSHGGEKSQRIETGRRDQAMSVPKVPLVETKKSTFALKPDKVNKISRPDIITKIPALVSCVHATKTVGKIHPILKEQSLQELEETFPWLSKGGHYKPTRCVPKEKTAIIFPFRDRLPHLHTLLLNLFPLLKRQNIDFTIFVIDQEKPTLFNRGMLFNIGFVEALELGDFDCFIFHDVDLIPLFDTNFYHCNESPTHFLGGVNKFKYGIMYNDLFGGVVSFTRSQFEAINGASNMYFGWGAEDDDLRKRIIHENMTILRTDRSVGLYDMIKHSKDKTNPVNPIRHWLLKSATKRIRFDGLSTLLYHRSSMDTFLLYTWIKVKIDARPIIMRSKFFTASQKDRMLDLFVPTPKNDTETPL